MISKKTIISFAVLGAAFILSLSFVGANFEEKEQYKKDMILYEKAIKEGAGDMPYIINKSHILKSSANLNNFSKDGSCLIEMGISKNKYDFENSEGDIKYSKLQKKFINKENMESEFFFTSAHERAHCTDLKYGGAFELYFDSSKMKEAMNNLTGGNNFFLPEVLYEIGIKEKKFYPPLQVLLLEGTAEAVSSINLINSNYYNKDVLVARAIRLQQDSYHKSAVGVRDHATASVVEYFLSPEGESVAKSFKGASENEIIEFSRKLSAHNVLSLAKNIENFDNILQSENYWKAHTASSIVKSGLVGAGMLGGEEKNKQRIAELNILLNNDENLKKLSAKDRSILSKGIVLEESMSEAKRNAIVNLVMSVDVLETDKEDFKIIREELSSLIKSFDSNKYPGFKSPKATIDSLIKMSNEKDNQIAINKKSIIENREHLFNSSKPILSI